MSGGANAGRTGSWAVGAVVGAGGERFERRLNVRVKECL